jgi:hypothetical protein
MQQNTDNYLVNSVPGHLGNCTSQAGTKDRVHNKPCAPPLQATRRITALGGIHQTQAKF